MIIIFRIPFLAGMLASVPLLKKIIPPEGHDIIFFPAFIVGVYLAMANMIGASIIGLV